MQDILVRAVTGGALGGIYALFALGLGLAFQAMRGPNLALGACAAAGAVAGVAVSAEMAVQLVPSALAGAALAAVLAGGLERLVFLPCRRAFARRRDPGASPAGPVLVVTLGAAVVLDRVVGLIGTNVDDGFRPEALPSATIALGAAAVPVSAFILPVLAALAAIMVAVVLRATRLGTAIRAVALDPMSAALAGVDEARATVPAAVLAGGVCGLAATLAVGVGIPAVPEVGWYLMLRGVAAVSLAGASRPFLAAGIGLLIGIGESVAAPFMPPGAAPLVAAAALLAGLLLHPRAMLVRRLAESG